MKLLRHKKINLALLTLILALVALRAFAPFVIKSQANTIIAKNPKISGEIQDVDLWLLSGSMALDGINITKADSDIPAPIFSADSIRFSVSWKDLFRGKLFGDIVIQTPILNVVDGKREASSQTGAEIDWREALTSFYPFRINRIDMNHGEVHFRNFNSQPPVDIYLENIEAEATNITNELSLENSKAAQINLEANTIGSGRVVVNSEFNLALQPATALLKAELIGMDLTSINDFAKAYANLDLQDGEFNLSANLNFSENEEIADIDGELKPTLSRLDVLRWREDAEVQGDSGVTIAWEGAVDLVKWLLEVGKQDSIATTIPVTGSIKDPDIGVGSAIFTVLKNAITKSLPGREEKEEEQEPQ